MSKLILLSRRKAVETISIKVIIPIVDPKFNKAFKKEIKTILAPDAEFDLVNVSQGTDSIESRYQEFLDTKSIIERSKQAQADGFDAIYIDCFAEPGVGIVRELVDIPVVGGFWPAVLTANAIAQRYSIITVLPGVIPMLEDLGRSLGISDNIVSILDVGIPVQDLTDEKQLKKKLVKKSLEAIDQGAQAIVLGCTGMLGVAEAVQQKLAKKNKPAPVIDPTKAAITMLQSLVRMGLSQSRLTYYPPPDDTTGAWASVLTMMAGADST
jgi:allantoin racemase